MRGNCHQRIDSKLTHPMVEVQDVSDQHVELAQRSSLLSVWPSRSLSHLLTSVGGVDGSDGGAEGEQRRRRTVPHGRSVADDGREDGTVSGDRQGTTRSFQPR